MSTLSIPFLPPSSLAASKPSLNPAMYEGKYLDPINHPGGTRTIKVTGQDGEKGFYKVELTGGGGKGEPKNYTLPAQVSKDGSKIIIDFSPKGGPKDFVGVFDDELKGIKFLKDGNFWPMQTGEKCE
ncbi:hypothetical protein TrRE_jg7808 [Triparma retinervis]|uniref:Uncharacterized protein n=1 Tax=Triparma retinervis TaxID=2557542 RepID=A0A9W6ZIU9_9STRA|nr:hypothetical protein TrRE_jg7808 [Triparma retinervis]